MIFSYEMCEAAPGEPTDIVGRLGIRPGTYENGLLAVFDRAVADVALAGWRWLLGPDAVALAATGFGDLFFWSESQSAVYFLEVQRGRSTFVDRDPAYFFNEFLAKEGVKDRVLSAALVSSLTARLGRLPYGKCFIAEPWPLVGGSGTPDTYKVGDLDVYQSLVAQAVQRHMDRLRT